MMFYCQETKKFAWIRVTFRYCLPQFWHFAAIDFWPQ